MEQLIKENERLKREVESYSEKAARLQKVREYSFFACGLLETSLNCDILGMIPHFAMDAKEPAVAFDFHLRSDLQRVWNKKSLCAGVF